MRDLTLELSFTERERAIIALVFAGALVAGIWMGTLLVPAEALDVPTTTMDTSTGQHVNAAYLPITGAHVALTFLVPAIAIYYGYVVTDPRPGPDDESVAADGGEDSDV
jgi:hypothetical protein